MRGLGDGQVAHGVICIAMKIDGKFSEDMAKRR